MSRFVAASLGFVAGCAAVCAGVFLLAGLAVALIVAGLVTATSCLVLVDTDDTDTGGKT